MYTPEPVTSVRHGYRFDNMFNRGSVVFLQDKALRSFFFDKAGNYAGLSLQSSKDSYIYKIVSPDLKGELEEIRLETEFSKLHD